MEACAGRGKPGYGENLSRGRAEGGVARAWERENEGLREFVLHEWVLRCVAIIGWLCVCALVRAAGEEEGARSPPPPPTTCRLVTLILLHHQKNMSSSSSSSS